MSSAYGEIFTEEDIRQLVVEACESAGNQQDFANENSISAQYVCDVIKGRRRPGASVARIFGLVPVVVYIDANKVDK